MGSGRIACGPAAEYRNDVFFVIHKFVINMNTTYSEVNVKRLRNQEISSCFPSPAALLLWLCCLCFDYSQLEFALKISMSVLFAD